MADQWKWESGGLYDGDVEIVWPVQDVNSRLYVGVMADWEDAIANVPALVEALREIQRQVAESTDDEDRFGYEYLGKIADIAKAALAAAGVAPERNLQG